MAEKKAIVFPWEGLLAALLAWLIEWLRGREVTKSGVGK